MPKVPARHLASLRTSQSKQTTRSERKKKKDNCELKHPVPERQSLSHFPSQKQPSRLAARNHFFFLRAIARFCLCSVDNDAVGKRKI